MFQGFYSGSNDRINKISLLWGEVVKILFVIALEGENWLLQLALQFPLTVSNVEELQHPPDFKQRVHLQILINNTEFAVLEVVDKVKLY